MATKLKNIKLHAASKTVAILLLMACSILMIYSLTIYGITQVYYDGDESEPYLKSESFGESYYALTESIMKQYLYYQDEEHISSFYTSSYSNYYTSGDAYDDWDYSRDLNEFRNFQIDLTMATSFRYYLENKTTGETFTNLKDNESIDDLKALTTAVEFIKGDIVYPNNSTMQSVLKNSSSFNNYSLIRNQLVRITGLQQEALLNEDHEWYLLTAVQTPISTEDRVFYLNSIIHDTYADYTDFAHLGIILGLVSSLFLLIYLSFVTGKTPSHPDKASLSFYDKIPFEIQSGISVLLAMPLIILVNTTDNIVLYNMEQMLSFLGSIALLTGAVMIQYLSFVRHIKTDNLSNHVLVFKLCKWMWNLLVQFVKMPAIENSARIKVFIMIGLYLILSTIGLLALVFNSGFGFIILILVNVGALRLILKFLHELNYIKSSLNKRRHNQEVEPFAGKLQPVFQTMEQDMDALAEGLRSAIQEQMKGEQLKTELITNVTHDLKNPLTSIINYVTLLKEESIENETVKGYVDVLDDKSRRLKTLIDQLVEASKASTGNMMVKNQVIDITQLNRQLLGEFEEDFINKDISLIRNDVTPPVYVMADPSILYRILENLMSNINKYAMEHSRVYMDLIEADNHVELTMKNMSKDPLNIGIEELTKRFVRGDDSRTEEGSGLGLSIALSLAKLIQAELILDIDGDLFKSTLRLPKGQIETVTPSITSTEEV